MTTSISNSTNGKTIIPKKTKITADDNSEFRFPLKIVLILMIIGIAVVAIILGVRFDKNFDKIYGDKYKKKSTYVVEIKDTETGTIRQATTQI